MGIRAEPNFFPSPSSANAEGILCVGGDLSVETLVDAYCHGIFPWPVEVEDLDEELLVWWSPDPRAIVDWEMFRIPRRLERKIRNSDWTITSDKKFPEVIQGCATENNRQGNTWINEDITNAYYALHLAGYAHSVEVLAGEELIGGIYGVAIGGMFAAESMFYRKPTASKIALTVLLAHLRSRGFKLFDIQQMTPHMESCGAIHVDRNNFLDRLHDAVLENVSFGHFELNLSASPEWLRSNI